MSGSDRRAAEKTSWRPLPHHEPGSLQSSAPCRVDLKWQTEFFKFKFVLFLKQQLFFIASIFIIITSGKIFIQHPCYNDQKSTKARTSNTKNIPVETQILQSSWDMLNIWGLGPVDLGSIPARAIGFNRVMTLSKLYTYTCALANQAIHPFGVGKLVQAKLLGVIVLFAVLGVVKCR